MHKHVELLLGRLATNPRLRARFWSAPREVLRTEVLELTDVELEAVLTTPSEAFHDFADALDERLCRAAPIGDGLDHPTTSSSSLEIES